MFAVLAEFERELIAERTRAGLAAARARGKNGGRPRKMDKQTIQMATTAMSDRNTKAMDVAKKLGVTTTNLYDYIMKKILLVIYFGLLSTHAFAKDFNYQHNLNQYGSNIDNKSYNNSNPIFKKVLGESVSYFQNKSNSENNIDYINSIRKRAEIGANQYFNQKINKVENKISDYANNNFNTNLSLDIERSNQGSYHTTLMAVQPLFQLTDFHFLTQISGVHSYINPDAFDSLNIKYNNNRHRGTANIGLVNRYYNKDYNFIFGINTFYDRSFPFNHSRIGFGGEVFYNNFEFIANKYHAISDSEIHNNLKEKAISGYDYELNSTVPYLNWLKIGYKGQVWDYDRKQKDNALFCRAKILPSLDFSYSTKNLNRVFENSQYQNNRDHSFYLSFTRSYGSRTSLFTTPISSKAFIYQNDFKNKLYQPVQRQNFIKVQSECMPFAHADMLKSIGFDRYVDICGFAVAAEAGVTDAQLLDVAAVAAEYLDNDEDGYIDDPKLLNSLVSNRMFFPVIYESVATEGGSGSSQSLLNNMENMGFDLAYVSVSGLEIDYNSPTRGMMPVYEEVNHVIYRNGYRITYPEVFSDQHGSPLASCMDSARGGYFTSIPSGGSGHDGYPASAWWAYDDPTCEYSLCQIDEYFYNAFVVTAGIANQYRQSGKCGFANGDAWNLCTINEITTTDSCIYNLMTNAQYKLPLNNNWDRNYNAIPLSITNL